VPHFEVVEVAQFDIPLANAFHPGGGRPAAKPVDKLPHGRLFALDVQVNPANCEPSQLRRAREPGHESIRGRIRPEPGPLR
jgi:hypothetical protein